MKKAVLWDFGGVISSSPFEAFNVYESANGVPLDHIRTVNATNPHDNAWARLERSELSPEEFDELFAQESASLGHEVRGSVVLGLIGGVVHPEMVAMLDRVKAAGYKMACLTNNMSGVKIADDRSRAMDAVMDRFDVVVESAKVGIRKPEPRFYEIACEQLGVHPQECVFLDDLGVNLKPAAAMGMTTIKVLNPAQAIADLSHVLGFDGATT